MNDQTTNDRTLIDHKRLDRFLNGIYGTATPTKYKESTRRTYSFREAKTKLEKDSTVGVSSRIDKFRSCVAVIRFLHGIENESAQTKDFQSPTIYSRRFSHSTNYLQIAKHTQKNIIHNWSGIHAIAREHQLVRPDNVNQLIRLVQTATSKITVMGSGLTFEKLMSIQPDDPQAKLISMEHFRGLVEMKKGTAVFGAATPVNDVIAILASYNRMLPCSPGVIGIQTLAGAMNTGTHGQGLSQASYSDIVKSLHVILPNGKVITIDEHTVDYPLQAFVTAMGTLGILFLIELVHVPRRIFSCRKFTCKLDALLSDYVQWNEQHEFVKVWWFPETNLCHVWFVDEADEQQCEQFLATTCDALLESTHEHRSINDTIHQYMVAMEVDTKATKESSQPQFETLKRFLNAKDVIGYVEQILCKGIPVPQVNCEIAIPLEHVCEATLAIQSWADQHEKSLHYPFIYRVTGQSKAWLSPACKGPVCYIGFLVYLAEDGCVRGDGMTTMHELQTILASFDGIPHWGKHFTPDIYDFERVIPKWKDFLDLRARLDPKKKMLSAFLESIFKMTDIVL